MISRLFLIISNTVDMKYFLSSTRSWHQEDDHDKNAGMWFEKSLVFNEVTEKDLYMNYTCQAHSSRGIPKAYFTLLPEGETSKLKKSYLNIYVKMAKKKSASKYVIAMMQ